MNLLQFRLLMQVSLVHLFFPGVLQDAALNKKLEEFKRLSSNIKLIHAHDALLILKASSSTSHVLFILRCSPCIGNTILSQIDEVLKSNISHIANFVLSDIQRIQASLPVKAGGLGIRRAAFLALPTYLASATMHYCFITRSFF